MNSIKIYEVDTDGNKIPLASNEYTLQFQNGKSVSDGAGLLKLTIPDEKHIVIDYTYKIIANEKTPSVINKCKSSTRVNGRYVTMEPGLIPPAGDKITFSNEASLKADSASSSSSQNNKEYEISKSSGTISTNRLPNIKKVNTGDYTINDLKAKFLFAKYENNQWFYATAVDEQTRVITWSETGYNGTAIDPSALEIDVDKAYEVALSQNVLYKLVEVSVPDGYEGSNLGLNNSQFKAMLVAYLNNGTTVYNGKDYKIFLENYVSAHYFSYNSILNSYPQGITAQDVMQIKSGDNIEIPNNELIDIGISKNWISSESMTNTEITVELYWSYEKTASGMPESATLATAQDLGIMDSNFTASKTVSVSADNSQLWKDLPNGKNNKPVYYYVKETAYKINNKTYTLDSVSGTYKNGNETGAYYPTYIGNATNSDSVIEIRNSAQLMLKKEWKKSNNEIMKNPPVERLTVSIYGLDENGTKIADPIFSDIELSKDNNWKFDVTSLINGETDISQYKGFVAVESGISEEISSNFVVSCVFNINSSTGEIIVTNKSTAPTDASVKVIKVWSDSNEMHANDSIQVTLYQKSGTPIDLNGSSWQTIVKSLTPFKTAILTAENEWNYTWTGLPLENESQELYYYYVLETLEPAQSQYNPSYAVTDKSVSKTEYTITNSRNAIVAKKQWKGEDGEILSATSGDIPVSEIKLEVHKKAVQVPESGLKIVAFGDSITDGYAQSEPNCSKNGKDYPSKLVALLKANNYTITNGSDVNSFNKGISGQQIGGSDTDGFRGRVSSNIPSDTNIVFFLGGTNDIHQSGSSVRGNPDGVYERFVACITKIKTQAPNAVIFVGSIPHFD
ncbi:MAG: Cna B-type domain-containing protein, partial [Ruminococcus sp.]|nr:Cna B-type domain-containing protein [Ruminococcus sp.]